jgi:antirestriction protein ArdC
MRDVYQELTNKIVAQMEQAQAWEKPWSVAAGIKGGTMRRPINAMTGRAYRGLNVVLLWSAGRADPRWATFNAWKKAGASVNKGEKGTQIVFWKRIDREPTDDDDRDYILTARVYYVFNAEQCDLSKAKGIRPFAPSVAPTVTTDDAGDTMPSVDQWIAATGADIKHGGDRAFYSPAADYIQMPPRSAFKATKHSTALEAYYGTALHELAHWTGHTSRNKRDFSGRFGSRSYAFEELVAELSAAFLCADLGVTSEPRQDHANYLASWIQTLKDDKRALFTAASQAEKACDFLHGKQPSAEEDDAAEDETAAPIPPTTEQPRPQLALAL